MSTRSLRNKLERIRAALPPPAPPYSELPVEEWVADAEVGQTPSDSYLGSSKDEEVFFDWLEDLPKRLTFSLHITLVRARNEKWDITDPIPPCRPRLTGAWWTPCPRT